MKNSVSYNNFFTLRFECDKKSRYMRVSILLKKAVNCWHYVILRTSTQRSYDFILRNRLFRWRIAIFDRRNECWSQLHFITIVTVRHFPTNISARLSIVSVRPECTASYAPPNSHAVQHLNGRVIASLMVVWAECHVTSCNSVFQLSFWIDCVACSDSNWYTWYFSTLHVHISRPGECVTWFMTCVWRCE